MPDPTEAERERLLLIAALRALLAHGPSEGMVEKAKEKMAAPGFAEKIWQAMLTQLIAELEGK